MEILEKAASMLEKYPLCDHCLGRQFALLGHGLNNDARGGALKLVLTLEGSSKVLQKNPEGVKDLKVVATNGFFQLAEKTLKQMKKRKLRPESRSCFLCEGRFQKTDALLKMILEKTCDYEYDTFLIGIEMPVRMAEREDEFKAAYNVGYGESLKQEFGRVLGKLLEAQTGKKAEFRIPDLMMIINPFNQTIKLQVNPLFVAGRYRKLVRDIPQSKWFCSGCHGKGCKKCSGTGLQYLESVEAFISKPLLNVAEGEKSSFHASGREDIDALMLGSGRPFVVEISKPKKRSIDLKRIKENINSEAKGKVEVSRLRFTNREAVRKLKKSENAQKEYRALVAFEHGVSDEDMQMLQEKLTGILIKQQTPLRVVHRRADLVRERYIYKLKVKNLSPKEALMEVRCQGGLYVKELVSGDEGRTVPSVTELLNNQSKIIKLDVLKVIMDDQ